MNVLLVDDNPFVCKTYQEALILLGFKVSTAKDGHDALNQFKLNSNKFNIIVSDIVMPEMSGIQLVRYIRIIRPDIPAIFITGYDSEINAPGALSNCCVLKKPFLIDDLVKKIRGYGTNTVELLVPIQSTHQ